MMGYETWRRGLSLRRGLRGAANGAAELCSAWTGEGARPHTHYCWEIGYECSK
jgi:hypothetical protein